MEDLLNKLTPIRPGQPLAEVMTAERLTAIQDLLLLLAAGSNIRSGEGALVNAGRGGVTIGMRTRRTRAWQGRPFVIRDCRRPSTTWIATLQPGYCCESHAKLPGGANDGPAVKIHVPLVNHVPITGHPADADPPPPYKDDLPDLELAGATSFNYLHLLTDEDGQIKSVEKPPIMWADPEVPEFEVAATVESHAAEKESIHHIPKHPEPPDAGPDGQEGDYYFELFRTVPDGDDALKITYKLAGENFHWRKELWRGRNLGAAENIGNLYKRILKGHRWLEEDVVEFRPLMDAFGILAEEDPEDDDGVVRLDFLANNVGDEGYAQEVFAKPVVAEGAALPNEAAKFRRIGGRGSYIVDGDDAGVTQQIRMVLPPEAAPGDPPSKPLRVVGNGRVGTLVFVDDATPPAEFAVAGGPVAWNDGLWTNSGQVVVTIPIPGGSTSGSTPIPGVTLGAVMALIENPTY